MTAIRPQALDSRADLVAASYLLQTRLFAADLALTAIGDREIKHWVLANLVADCRDWATSTDLALPLVPLRRLSIGPELAVESGRLLAGITPDLTDNDLVRLAVTFVSRAAWPGGIHWAAPPRRLFAETLRLLRPDVAERDVRDLQRRLAKTSRRAARAAGTSDEEQRRELVEREVEHALTGAMPPRSAGNRPVRIAGQA